MCAFQTGNEKSRVSGISRVVLPYHQWTGFSSVRPPLSFFSLYVNVSDFDGKRLSVLIKATWPLWVNESVLAVYRPCQRCGTDATSCSELQPRSASATKNARFLFSSLCNKPMIHAPDRTNRSGTRCYWMFLQNLESTAAETWSHQIMPNILFFICLFGFLKHFYFCFYLIYIKWIKKIANNQPRWLLDLIMSPVIGVCV